MVACAHRVVVLADSSKVGREHTVRFAGVDDIDVLVTDTGIADPDLRALRSRDLEVVVA
jgi:DeoR family fructose operon transcriptional repressor